MKLFFIIFFSFLILENSFAISLFSSENDNIFTDNNSRPRPKRSMQATKFNVVFAETGLAWRKDSEGIKMSINYDIILQLNETNGFSARIGYEQLKLPKQDRIQIPLFINLFLGIKNYVEFSGGAFWDIEGSNINPALSVGYRHQNPTGGLFYRGSFFITSEKEYSLISNREVKRIWFIGPTAGIGWSF